MGDKNEPKQNSFTANGSLSQGFDTVKMVKSAGQLLVWKDDEDHDETVSQSVIGLTDVITDILSSKS